jgi:hypothetical protein
MKWVKPLVIIVIVLFAVFFTISRPEEAANAVQGAVDAVATAGAAMGRFFTSLAS